MNDIDTRLLDRARRYSANAASVASWAHPDWLACAFGQPMPARDLHDPDVPASSALLLARLRIVPPTLCALVPSHSQRRDAILLLPPYLTMRAWQMRALLARTGELRRTIDLAGRRFVGACLGDSAIAFRAAADDVMSSLPQPSPLAMHDAIGLAWEGFSLISNDKPAAREGAAGVRDTDHARGAHDADSRLSPWSSLSRLPRLMLPPNLTPNLSIRDSRSACVFERALPTLFPEYAWLFG